MISLGWVALGLIALIAGAELIVRCGSHLAARLGISPIVIGLTIVAIGTSTPELAVGIDAGLRGSGPLAVANIAGTNIVNILLILGLSALLQALPLAMQTLRLDLPFMAVAALAFLVAAQDGVISRAEGLALLAAGLAYTVLLVRAARRESLLVRAEFEAEYGAPSRKHSARQTALDLIGLLLGIVVIVLGSDWLVSGAVDLARRFGVSESFLGLTIIAIGTSSPELVTMVIGTLRNDRDIAIGNLIGSSIYNILVILGLTALAPANGLAIADEVVRIDIPLMTAAALACLPVFFSNRSVSRLEGGAFVAAYAVYLVYLVIART